MRRFLAAFAAAVLVLGLAGSAPAFQDAINWKGRLVCKLECKIDGVKQPAVEQTIAGVCLDTSGGSTLWAFSKDGSPLANGNLGPAKKNGKKYGAGPPTDDAASSRR